MQTATHSLDDSRAGLHLPMPMPMPVPLRRPVRVVADAAPNEGVTQDLHALRAAYLHRGGLVSGEVVVGLLRGHVEQPLSQLARWIVTGEIVSVDDHTHTLIPLFQFDPQTMAIRTDVREVTAALAQAFDGREMAEWFVRPNAWLAGELPIDALANDVPAVVQAARGDRFVATGWA